MYVDLLLRWVHILSAIILVGGTFFMRFALLDDNTDDDRQSYLTGIRSRWAKWVAASSGLLLISGLVNLFGILGRYEIDRGSFPGSIYHAVFGIKFLLALAVFFLAATLSGRRSLALRLRQNEKMWLNLNLVLAVTVVCLAGIMKFADRSPKAAVPADAAEQAVLSEVASPGIPLTHLQ